jgi:hypothetical protein
MGMEGQRLGFTGDFYLARVGGMALIRRRIGSLSYFRRQYLT